MVHPATVSTTNQEKVENSDDGGSESVDSRDPVEENETDKEKGQFQYSILCLIEILLS